jgi:uncharacterized membrane protein YtjA (UPF0391 family)
VTTWAIAFLVIALMTAGLGFGVAGTAFGAAKLAFVAALLVLLIWGVVGVSRRGAP